MTSSPTSSLRPSQGSPQRWDGFRQWLRGVNRTRKIFEDAFDSSKSPWPSIKGRAKPVAESSTDPFLIAKTLTIATRAIHHCLDDFCKDQNSLQLSVQSTHWMTKPWLLRTPIREFDTLQCPFPKGALLRTLRRFLKPSPSSSLFPNFSQRVSHWVCRLQVTGSRYTTDALVHVRRDKYPKTSSHKEAISGNSVSVEVFIAFLQQEKTCKMVLDLDDSSQPLDSSRQPGLNCSRCSSFARQNREHSCIYGPCTTFEDANYILQVVGLNGRENTIRNCLHKFKGSNGEPEDNAGSIGREKESISRAPADGEASQKPPKRQRHHDQQSPHYDEGTNGPVQTVKKRKQESREKGDVDWDESGEASGKIKNSRKRKDEEEETRKFACPFYKYDWQAFKSSRTCVGPGWDSVHRVKEHIFRRHMLTRTQCESCLERFENEPVFDEHVRNLCRKKPPSGSYGINKEQEKQLRSRKMYQKSSDEEEKWRAIYRIIFPREKDIPSPYYDPELPEIPGNYQQMLMQDLPKIVARRLTAPELGLAEHISPNSMASRQSSTSQTGKKLNGGLDLMGSTPASVGSQLEQHIQDAVKAAVEEMLSEVLVSKEPNTGPQITVKSPKEEPNGRMKMEEQGQFEKQTQLESNLLQLPGMVGTELKLDTYSTPRSLVFSRSPEVPLTAVEQTLPKPSSLEQAPQGTGFCSLFNENHSGNVLEHIPGVTSFPELDSLVSNTWEDFGDNSTSLAVPVHTSAGLNLSLNFSEPASHQSQELWSALESEPESFALGPWEFSPAPAIQSADSEYGTIIGPPTSNSFDDLGDLDDQITESFI